MRVKVYTPSSNFLKLIASEERDFKIGEHFKTEIGISAQSLTPPRVGFMDGAEVWEFVLDIPADVAKDLLVTWLLSKFRKGKATKVEIDEKEVSLTE